MLDWRILAASFAALLVVSTVLIGNFGIRDFLSDIIGKISEWLGSSPFGGFFSQPPAKASEVIITLYPSNFTIKPDTYINITSDNTSLNNFKGELDINFKTGRIVLSETDSRLVINLPLSRTEITGLGFSDLKTGNLRFAVASSESNMTTSNGSMEIYNFFGECLIEDGIQLRGNVSKIKGSNWEIG